jgi:hypothetical protein
MALERSPFFHQKPFSNFGVEDDDATWIYRPHESGGMIA